MNRKFRKTILAGTLGALLTPAAPAALGHATPKCLSIEPTEVAACPAIGGDEPATGFDAVLCGFAPEPHPKPHQSHEHPETSTASMSAVAYVDPPFHGPTNTPMYAPQHQLAMTVMDWLVTDRPSEPIRFYGVPPASGQGQVTDPSSGFIHYGI